MVQKNVYLVPTAAAFDADNDDFMARVVTASDPTAITGLTNDTPYVVLAGGWLTESEARATPSAAAGLADNGVVFDGSDSILFSTPLSMDSTGITFFLDGIPATDAGIQRYIEGYEEGSFNGAGMVERGATKVGGVLIDNTNTGIGSDLRLQTWTNASRYRAIIGVRIDGSNYEIHGASKVGTAGWTPATTTTITGPVNTPYWGDTTRIGFAAQWTFYRLSAVATYMPPNADATREYILDADGTTLPDVTVLQTAAGANLLLDLYGDASTFHINNAGTFGTGTVTGGLVNA